MKVQGGKNVCFILHENYSLHLASRGQYRLYMQCAKAMIINNSCLNADVETFSLIRIIQKAYENFLSFHRHSWHPCFDLGQSHHWTPVIYCRKLNPFSQNVGIMDFCIFFCNERSTLSTSIHSCLCMLSDLLVSNGSKLTKICSYKSSVGSSLSGAGLIWIKMSSYKDSCIIKQLQDLVIKLSIESHIIHWYNDHLELNDER